MYKSIAIQYVFAVTLWVLITFVGYWCDPVRQSETICTVSMCDAPVAI